MRRRLVPLVAFALVIAGCADPEGPPPTRSQDTPPTPPPATPTPTRTATEPNATTPSTPPPSPPPSGPTLALEPTHADLDMPVLLTHAGDGSGRVFLVEQRGVVHVVVDAERRAEPFLDARDKTEAEGERGFLGLAFSPDFANDRRVYASYTDTKGDSVLARYLVSEDDANRVDAATEEILLKVAQPFANHNGGHIAFGPDGYLYYALGDGGAGGDPQANGQDPHALLGSLLRLDVSPAQGYAIPPDNPYVSGEHGAREVWAKGLRNPWRFSFDAETRDLHIADVGQGAWEEVNFQEAGAAGGANYGWNVYEGAHRFAVGARPFSPVTNPVAEYPHEEGACSITGGHVYRGDEIPKLQGVYLYADYCNGKLWGLKRVDGSWQTALILETEHRISSFGLDERRELYVVDHGGAILRIVDGGGPLPDVLRGG